MKQLNILLFVLCCSFISAQSRYFTKEVYSTPKCFIWEENRNGKMFLGIIERCDTCSWTIRQAVHEVRYYSEDTSHTKLYVLSGQQGAYEENCCIFICEDSMNDLRCLNLRKTP